MEQQKYYLRIKNKSFGFVLEGLHEIKKTDIEISNDDYNTFFELQSTEGKQFRLKEQPTGATLFDYVEAYEVEPGPVDNTPTTEERIAALELALLEVL